jgi:hypothetical protein
MTPEQIAKAGTEHAHQAALFCWANSVKDKYPMLQLMHAIPNGGLRNKVTASRLKAEGVKKGVCDVFLPYPVISATPLCYGGEDFHGLYIEMKKPGKGVLSEDQKTFIAEIQKLGYGAVVCETWEEASEAIMRYLSQSS